ncbi:hypothetical protein D9M69_527650 [compost metagenome]
MGMILILKEVPAFLHSCLCGIVQRPHGQVVKHSVHVFRAGRFHIVPDRGQGVIAADDIAPDLLWRLPRSGQGLVVFIVPVIKLDPVNVVTVQGVDGILHRTFRHAPERGKKTVPGKFFPVTRNIHGHAVHYFFTR